MYRIHGPFVSSEGKIQFLLHNHALRWSGGHMMHRMDLMSNRWSPQVRYNNPYNKLQECCVHLPGTDVRDPVRPAWSVCNRDHDSWDEERLEYTPAPANAVRMQDSVMSRDWKRRKILGGDPEPFFGWTWSSRTVNQRLRKFWEASAIWPEQRRLLSLWFSWHFAETHHKTGNHRSRWTGDPDNHKFAGYPLPPIGESEREFASIVLLRTIPGVHESAMWCQTSVFVPLRWRDSDNNWCHYCDKHPYPSDWRSVKV